MKQKTFFWKFTVFRKDDLQRLQKTTTNQQFMASANVFDETGPDPVRIRFRLQGLGPRLWTGPGPWVLDRSRKGLLTGPPMRLYQTPKQAQFH